MGRADWVLKHCSQTSKERKTQNSTHTRDTLIHFQLMFHITEKFNSMFNKSKDKISISREFEKFNGF